MKKLLTIAALVGVTAWSYGQGQITFANGSTTLISTNSTHGGPAGGSTMVNPGGGAYQFVYALFVAASTVTTYTGASDPNWQNAFAYATNTTSATGGRLAGGQPILPTPYATGTTAAMIIRAWSTSVGGLDWASVGGSPLWGGAAGQVGQYLYTSPIELIAVGGAPNPITGTFGVTPGTSFQGFTMDQVTTIPEPGTFALAGLGAAALLIFRRRK